jgi:hypothetical protein
MRKIELYIFYWYIMFEQLPYEIIDLIYLDVITTTNLRYIGHLKLVNKYSYARVEAITMRHFEDLDNKSINLLKKYINNPSISKHEFQRLIGECLTALYNLTTYDNKHCYDLCLYHHIDIKTSDDDSYIMLLSLNHCIDRFYIPIVYSIKLSCKHNATITDDINTNITVNNYNYKDANGALNNMQNWIKLYGRRILLLYTMIHPLHRAYKDDCVIRKIV